jgi:hypothetical protein
MEREIERQRRMETGVERTGAMESLVEAVAGGNGVPWECGAAIG